MKSMAEAIRASIRRASRTGESQSLYLRWGIENLLVSNVGNASAVSIVTLLTALQDLQIEEIFIQCGSDSCYT